MHPARRRRRSKSRKVFNWLLRLFAMAVVLIAVWLAVLAWPSAWFSHSQRLGNVTFHADFDFDGKWPAILADIAWRYEAVPIFDSTLAPDVYFFSEQDNYSLMARLALVPDVVPGFNLSIFDNSYISLPGLAARRERNRENFPYSSISGDIAQCVTHELIHGLIQERVGYAAVLSIPRWKAEGYCEYNAARLPLETNAVTLRERIDLLDHTPAKDRTREYYRYNLLVNFLIDQEQMTLEGLLDENVTLTTTKEAMTAWYQTTPNSTSKTASDRPGDTRPPASDRADRDNSDH